MRTVSSVLFALSVQSNPWALGQQPKPLLPDPKLTQATCLT